LRKAPSRLPVDVVITGDYQPAEKKYQVSRRMLDVCLELGFSVSVLERSPFALRDPDLLQEINQQSADFGILTCASMMPIPPGLCDTDENLEATICCTASHGRTCVLGGGLTLAEQQRDFTMRVLAEHFLDPLPLYEQLYPAGSYSAVRSGGLYAIGRRVRELCLRYCISDRMPWPITPGDKRALNNLIAEALANQCYWLELDNAAGQRVWTYRKAA